MMKFEKRGANRSRWLNKSRRGSASTALAGLILLACNCLADDARTAEHGQSTQLRVMSFNVRYGTARDGENHWDLRKDFLVETIRAYDPDLLGTQETLGFQRDYIAEHLPEYGCLGVGRDDGDERGEMMAVYYRVSRFEKLDEGHFWLSETPEIVGSVSWDSSLPRMVTWLQLRDRLHPTASPIVFLNTHFDHLGATARTESARLIRRHIESLLPGNSIILTGDFNAGEDSAPYRALLEPSGDDRSPLVDTFRAAHPNRTPNEGTFSAFKADNTGGARIDWILVSRDWQTVDAAIDRTSRDGRSPSDHFPVTAVLERSPVQQSVGAGQPNLIWIMADDLGYGELGSYGQEVILTPNLDRMAAEGMRFTQFYAGATVCAPSRSVLMTGQHHGRTRVRGNAGAANPEAQALQPGDVTVAHVLKEAGYRTALIGKWGLGDVGAAETGLPRKQGFDYFFGYLNQRHAHNHFPDFLWRNEQRVELPNVVTPVGGDGAGYATEAVIYADELFTEESLRFVSENRDRPFFLYWSMVIPHANNERTRELGDGAHVPDYGPYADKDWPQQDKGHAQMITLLDSYVGRLLDRLQAEGLAETTLVIFTSDNGPHNESRHNLSRFQPSGRLSGIKRSLTDGGIRVPTIAWWPGKVPAGTVSDHVGYFGDWMATAAQLAGAQAPDDLDSISFVPALLGRPDAQEPHEFLYWEFHEGGFRQAALYKGRWKGHRSGAVDAPVRLYDLSRDMAEVDDVAAANPEIAGKISDYLQSARTFLPEWEPRWRQN